MRHLRIWAGILALAVVAALVPAVASAAPGDPCEAAYSKPMNSTEKLRKYLDCRLDRLDAGLQPAPTVTVTAPASPAATVTAPASASPTVSATPSSTATPAANGFPDATTTGVPSGWQPKTIRTGDYRVTTAGAVVEDVRITGGNLYIAAANVTLRRVEMIDGRIINFANGRCNNGLTLEQVSVVRQSHPQAWDPAIEAGGYTARNLKVDGWWEGPRVGGVDFTPACGPVVIESSWINVAAPAECWSNPDASGWHGDGIQGYMGAPLTVRDTAITLTGRLPNCGGNAALFYPDQGNSRATIDNVLLAGGGFPFRLGTPGTVRNLKVVDGSWEYGPTDVRDCSQVTWGTGNEVVKVNPDGTLTTVRALRC